LRGYKRDFNQSHAAGFNGYQPMVDKDVCDEAAKDMRLDVPARAKGVDKKALSISM